MTLIAFTVHPDHAEMITDTCSYSRGARSVSRTVKVHLLPLIDAMVATQGDAEFGSVADFTIDEHATESFDELVELMPTILEAVWSRTAAARPDTEGTAFLIGFSKDEGRFVAYRFVAERQFAAELVEGTHIIPSPLTTRPAEFELARLRASFDGPNWHAFLDQWATKPPLREPPHSDDEWRSLAMEARERALAPIGLKVFVAGELLWTRVERGANSSRFLMTFDDKGAELDKLIAGTWHPRGQVAPCGCGSQRKALDCCIPAEADNPCVCGSTKSLRDCCMVPVDDFAWASTVGLFTT